MVHIMRSKAFLHAILLSRYVSDSIWRIIPISNNYYKSMVSKPLRWGCSPSKWPNIPWLVKILGGDPRPRITYPSVGMMIHPTAKTANPNGNRSSSEPSLDVWHASANYDLRLPVLGGCQLVGTRWWGPLRWFITGEIGATY